MTIARLLEGRGSAVFSCDVSTIVREAAAMLADKRIGALPVLDQGAVVGIFSERDVIYGLASQGPAILDRQVGEVMTSPVVGVDPESDVMDALSLMTRRRIRHLPVMSGGVMSGFISIGDLVKYRIDHIEAEAEAMRNYIQAS